MFQNGKISVAHQNCAVADEVLFEDEAKDDHESRALQLAAKKKQSINSSCIASVLGFDRK
jgi:hypothetical protein